MAVPPSVSNGYGRETGCDIHIEDQLYEIYEWRVVLFCGFEFHFDWTIGLLFTLSLTGMRNLPVAFPVLTWFSIQ